MCCQLLQYLNDIVPEMAPLPRPKRDHVELKQGLFAVVINDIHTIASWGLSDCESSFELVAIRESLGKLQEDVCERLIDARSDGRTCYIHVALVFLEVIMTATLAPPLAQSGNETLFSLEWLEEKEIVWKLLEIRFRMSSVPKVEQFLTSLAKKGVVVKEEDFLDRLKLSTNQHSVRPDLCNAADLVLDISTYSDTFLERSLEWLETREADSIIQGSRTFSILRSLLTHDKHRRWEKRFGTLLRKCAISVPSRDLVECLREVADHCNAPHHETRSFKFSCVQMDDEQAKLLEACSSADMVLSISRDMAIRGYPWLHRTKEHVEKVETWKEKEMNLEARLHAPSNLTEALSTTFPYSRHETAKNCLQRLVLAQDLSSGLNPNKSSTFASAIAMAMSPELQALEALKNESLLHRKVVQQVEELSNTHVRQYDALRRAVPSTREVHRLLP